VEKNKKDGLERHIIMVIIMWRAAVFMAREVW